MRSAPLVAQLVERARRPHAGQRASGPLERATAAITHGLAVGAGHDYAACVVGFDRKLSLGSQSERGERTIERLLSASATCRLQGRSLFAYLSDVLSARIRGDPIPAVA